MFIYNVPFCFPINTKEKKQSGLLTGILCHVVSKTESRDENLSDSVSVMFHDSTQKSRWTFTDAEQIKEIRKATNRQWCEKVMATLEITRIKIIFRFTR